VVGARALMNVWPATALDLVESLETVLTGITVVFAPLNATPTLLANVVSPTCSVGGVRPVQNASMEQ